MRARGCVVLAPPWTAQGAAYFDRHGRIDRLRELGLAALVFDFSGFGDSPTAKAFYDRDVEDALGHAASESGGKPLFLWGVSSGGYWAHPVLARSTSVRAALFEDVAPHLLEWSARVRPWGRPVYAVFRRLLPAAYRFLDIRRHAAAFELASVVYLSGEDDPGIPPSETRRLADLSGGVVEIVPRCSHLATVKRHPERLFELAAGLFGDRSTLPSTAVG